MLFHSILHQDIRLLLGALTQPNNLAPKFSPKSLSKVHIWHVSLKFSFRIHWLVTPILKSQVLPGTTLTTPGLASSLLGSLQNRLKEPWNLFLPKALPSNMPLSADHNNYSAEPWNNLRIILDALNSKI